MSETLLVVIPSSGTYPGIWSRSLCVDEGLLKGSMLPFFHQAMEANMGIIVLNPNVNSFQKSDKEGNAYRTPIPFNETPEKHVLYVYDRIISRTTARNIVMIGYGNGGILAKSLLQLREESLLAKLRCIAFTESLHTLNNDLNFGLVVADSQSTRDFLENHAINWIASDLKIGTRNYVIPKVGGIMGSSRKSGVGVCV